MVAKDAMVSRSRLLLSFQNTFWTNISQSQRRTALYQFWTINETLFVFKLKQISDVCQAFVLLVSVGSCQDVGIANWMRQQLSQMVTDCSLCRGIQGISLTYIYGKTSVWRLLTSALKKRMRYQKNKVFFLRKESSWIVGVEYCACRNMRKRRMDI